MCDLDPYKKVKATHGHLVGDKILSVPGGIIKQLLTPAGRRRFFISLTNNTIIPYIGPDPPVAKGRINGI